MAGGLLGVLVGFCFFLSVVMGFWRGAAFSIDTFNDMNNVRIDFLIVFVFVTSILIAAVTYFIKVKNAFINILISTCIGLIIFAGFMLFFCDIFATKSCLNVVGGTQIMWFAYSAYIGFCYGFGRYLRG